MKCVSSVRDGVEGTLWGALGKGNAAAAAAVGDVNALMELWTLTRRNLPSVVGWSLSMVARRPGKVMMSLAHKTSHDRAA